MKHPNELNHFYYLGQTFDLDQKTMNEMIEDIQTLLNENALLQQRVTELEVKKDRIASSSMLRIDPLPYVESSNHPSTSPALPKKKSLF